MARTGNELIQLAKLIKLSAETAKEFSDTTTNGKRSRVTDAADRILAAADELIKAGQEMMKTRDAP